MLSLLTNLNLTMIMRALSWLTMWNCLWSLGSLSVTESKSCGMLRLNKPRKTLRTMQNRIIKMLKVKTFLRCPLKKTRKRSVQVRLAFSDPVSWILSVAHKTVTSRTTSWWLISRNCFVVGLKTSTNGHRCLKTSISSKLVFHILSNIWIWAQLGHSWTCMTDLKTLTIRLTSLIRSTTLIVKQRLMTTIVRWLEAVTLGCKTLTKTLCHSTLLLEEPCELSLLSTIYSLKL